MVDNLGFGWAISLLGFITVAMIPIPFIFFRLGPYLRARSRYVALREDLKPQQSVQVPTAPGGCRDRGPIIFVARLGICRLHAESYQDSLKSISDMVEIGRG
jgi:hypothetical protein